MPVPMRPILPVVGLLIVGVFAAVGLPALEPPAASPKSAQCLRDFRSNIWGGI